MHNKFNFTDTTGAQLDVVGKLTSTYFLTDHGLHAAQRLNGTEVDIAAKYKRPTDLFQLLTVAAIRVNNPCLEHGVTLPVTSLLLIIIFQRGEMADNRPAVTEWAQTHIHPEHLPVSGDLMQGSDKLLRQPLEPDLMFKATPGVSFTRLGISKNQVNVG